MRTKIQAFLRRLDNALEPTERDQALAEAKQKAADILAQAKVEARIVLQKAKTECEGQAPAVTVKLAERLRRIADKIEK